MTKNSTKKNKVPMKRATDPESKAALRVHLIESAQSLFLLEGFENVSMRKVAAKAGCSAGTLYLYFKSKKELLNELWIKDLENLQRKLLEIFDKNDAEMTKLKALFHLYVNYWIERPGHYELSFCDILENEDSGFIGAEEQLESMDEMFFSLIKQAKEKGQMSESIDPRNVLHSLIAAAHGVLNVHYTFSIVKIDPIQYAEMMITTLIKGWSIK